MPRSWNNYHVFSEKKKQQPQPTLTCLTTSPIHPFVSNSFFVECHFQEERGPHATSVACEVKETLAVIPYSFISCLADWRTDAPFSRAILSSERNARPDVVACILSLLSHLCSSAVTPNRFTALDGVSTTPSAVSGVLVHWVVCAVLVCTYGVELVRKNRVL